MKNVLFILAFGFSAASTMAADCMITTTRTACPGKENESYSKCPSGAQTCSKTVQTNDREACAASAIEACLNSRTDITKYKTITATLNGIDFARGMDFCDRDASYANGKYIVRDNFPFRGKADCK